MFGIKMKQETWQPENSSITRNLHFYLTKKVQQNVIWINRQTQSIIENTKKKTVRHKKRKEQIT